MAKKIKRVVVNQAYFGLLGRKAALVDDMFDGFGQVTFHTDVFKEYATINKAMDKLDGDDCRYEEPYEEPKPVEPKPAPPKAKRK